MLIGFQSPAEEAGPLEHIFAQVIREHHMVGNLTILAGQLPCHHAAEAGILHRPPLGLAAEDREIGVVAVPRIKRANHGGVPADASRHLRHHFRDAITRHRRRNRQERPTRGTTWLGIPAFELTHAAGQENHQHPFLSMRQFAREGRGAQQIQSAHAGNNGTGRGPEEGPAAEQVGRRSAALISCFVLMRLALWGWDSRYVELAPVLSFRTGLAGFF